MELKKPLRENRNRDVKDNSNYPLISIVVITYNSANYVLETLDSAKAQTYWNIELIISDDCSTDNTVELCHFWLKENKTRFIRSEVVTSNQNTGIASNGNRGMNAANGVWLKEIAGDDILQPDCITDYLEFISASTESIECLFAQIKQFTSDHTITIESSIIPDPVINPFYRASITAKEQYAMWINILDHWPLSTPSFFIKRDLMILLGGYDERYQFMEDLPFFLKILEHGIKIHFVPKVTVLYRIHKTSILRDRGDQIIQKKFQVSRDKFIIDYIINKVSWSQKIRLLHELFFDYLILVAGNKGSLARLIQKIGINLNPVRWSWFKRKFNKIFSQR